MPVIILREEIRRPTFSQAAWLLFIGLVIGYVAGHYGRAIQNGCLPLLW
jgi:hypothetical protein